MSFKAQKIVSRETILPVPIESFIFQLGADEIDYPEGSIVRSSLEQYLHSAAGWVENYTGKTIVSGVFDFFLDSFPPSCGNISLAIYPAIELLSFVYDDLDGQEQEISLSDIDIDLQSSALVIKPLDVWPIAQKRFNSVRLRVRAGMVTEDKNDLPDALRVAVLMLARHYRDNASATAPIKLEHVPMGVKSCCDQERLYWV